MDKNGKTVCLWIDDLRNPPDRPDTEYLVARSVNEAKALLDLAENKAWTQPIDYISIDHDAGIYAAAGGDFINVLNFLEYRQHVHGGKVYPIEIHSQNPAGVVNMRAIIQHNGWKEVF